MKYRRQGTQKEYQAMPEDTKARIRWWLDRQAECGVVVDQNTILVFTSEHTVESNKGRI